MKLNPICLGTVCLTFSILRAASGTLYVDLNSANPVSPYGDWSTAATNIQDAIDASSAGDQIWVTNGIYQTGGRVMAGDLTNRVALNKAVTVQSVNGPWMTIIQGAGATNGTAAVRCAWLTNNAALIGFTLKWGATRTSGDGTLQSGGGVWCASSNATVANCVIVSNTANAFPGGAYQGTLKNCLVYLNRSFGVCNATLNNCTVVSNANGGVVTLGTGVRATNSIIYFNTGAGIQGEGGAFSYCCTPRFKTETGNFSNNPQLFADGIHLTSSSPCIGAGVNVATGTDIFGKAWANPPAVGCTEWQPAPIVTPPQIQLTSEPVGFTIGRASIAGQPPLVCWWIENGVPLQDNGHFSFTKTTNLVATGVSFADAGSYQLVVSNAFGVVTSQVAQVVIHAVDAPGVNPIPPYSTWATAATTIQDAINIAAAGDIVLVTNGVYANGGKVMAGDLTNRVALTKTVTVTSVNGYSATVIQGAWDPVSTNGPGAVRCAWLTNGAVLNGFTLQNGATRATGDGYSGGPLESGGGVWCVSTNGAVSNCVLTNNSAIYGGGISYGTLNNSLVVFNLAMRGGGAYYATLNNCTVINNYTTTVFPNQGAGTFDCNARNSIVINNYDNILVPVNTDNYSFDTPGEVPWYYSCTSPTKSGVGNINAVNISLQFLDLFHIASTSPCRGAGSALYASGADLDGEPWANPPSMGCDEVIVSNLVGPLSVNLLAYQTNLLVSPPGSHRPGFFQGIITGRAAYVAWSFGDGPTFTNFGAGSSHQWTNSGDYTVTFTAYNNDNPTGVSTNTVVHVLPLNVPQLQSAVLLTNGFQFQFAGQLSANDTIQYTTNLTPPVAWQTLQTIIYSSEGAIQINDSACTNTARFYRVLAQ